MAKTIAKTPATPAPTRARAGDGALKAWVILRGYNSAVELADERPEFESDDTKAEPRIFGPFDSQERAAAFRERMMRRNPLGRDTGEVR